MIEDSATLTDRSSLAMRMPPTSLIICSRNRPGLLLDSVVSVLSGNVVPNEILIMDQSDEEHPVLATLGVVYGCHIRYVRTNARGECPARNEGILLACHELLPRSNRTPIERLGDVVFLAGVFYGIAKWLATQRIIS